MATRLFVRVGMVLASLAAEPLRSALQRDGMIALAASCDRALHTRGWSGLILAGMAEWGSLLRAIVGQHLGRHPRITGGWRPSSTPRRPRPAIRVGSDLRQAWRALRATRGTVALAVFSLAIGIGVNTAVFSILDALLFRPVPYADASRLAFLWSYYAPGKFTMKGGFNAALVVEWRTHTDLFDRVEANEAKSFIYDGATGAEMISGAVVTPGLMSMLGVPPRLGRLFVEGDGREGTERQVIVSERFWRERLGHDAEAIGRTIVLDGVRHDVIGVMPPLFRFPAESQQLWTPFDVAQPPAQARGRHTMLVPTVRFASGLSRAAIAERVIARGAAVSLASGADGQGSARVMPIGEVFDDRTSQSLLVLGGAVLFLLLIVCANVANLTLARSLSRTKDLAVRVALGASRADLFRVALLEHAVIGAIGAGAALIVARLLVAGASALLPDAMTMASLNAIDLDGRALWFLVAIASFTVLAFGLPPAWLATRASVASALGRESRSATGSVAARRLRSLLVVAEIALSIVLLVGAALMTRSLMKLQAIDTGIDTRGLMAIQLALPASAYADVNARRIFTDDLLARASRAPWATSVTAGALPPNKNMVAVGPLEFDDRPGQLTKPAMLAVYATWPRFFETAGIRILEGREPHAGDVEGAAVVSKDFAAKHWPAGSPLNARFKIGKGAWRVVVGVAAEVRRMSEDDDSREQEIYYPHDQVSGVMVAGRTSSAIAEYRTLVVRTDRPATAAQAVAAVVHEVDPRVIVLRPTLIEHEFADAIARPRIVFLVMVVFAGVGLVLAAAGLYGVLSYLVSQRLREIGIRVALGASPRDIGRLILGTGLGLAAIGLVIGLAAAVGLVRVMRTLLYAVEPTDPISVGLVVFVIVAAALAASWRPARNAMRVDPVTLLKAD